jgi:plasmanylethanolamine desaturase
MSTSQIVIQAVGVILVADFISGFVHWAEDAYARKDTPVIGRWIGQANIEHHHKPRAFIARSWWQSSWDLVLTSAFVVFGAWWLQALTWKIWLFAAVTSNANQIHKWAHQAPHENGRIVTWLQKFKLLQTQRHHGKHHSGTKNSHYCAITNFLNPLLEEIEFWKLLERFNARMFGLHRRADDSVK